MVGMDEAASWIALRSTSRVGDVVGRRLVDHFGGPREALDATREALEAMGLEARAAGRLARRLAAASRADAVEELRRVTARGARVIAQSDSEYPAGLRELPDAPLCLIALGRPLEPVPAVAVVGARRATSYGRDVARRLAEDLAYAGVAIVSGLARGIDAAAHEGALAAGGRTVAVLGSGVDNIYPPEHAELARRITADGTVLSERPMGAQPLPHHFPARNRIIAGMTLGTIVVEAGARSGALITAEMALDAGREVFAVPGRIDSLLSKGPHALIQEGAKLVRNAADVLDELAPALRGARPTRSVEAGDPGAGDPLLASLAGGPVGIDRLVQETGLPVSEVLARVLDLELAGLVTQHPGQRVGLGSCVGARLPRPTDSSKG